MTQQEILEYNKRCAEFLGWKLISKEDFNKLGEASYTGENKDIKWGIIEYLKFHSDWNWIMEVVEAIEKLGYKFQLGWNITALVSLVPNTSAKIAFIESENRKEAVVQAINQFLIWYNEHR